jgi:hypothetical protein
MTPIPYYSLFRLQNITGSQSAVETITVQIRVAETGKHTGFGLRTMARG